MNSKIFVALASYRDPLLTFTIKTAYANAAEPDNLVFGVVEQAMPGEALDLKHPFFKKLLDNNQLKYELISPFETQGCCWARAKTQEMYNGEEFYSQFDSHTGFEDNWDLIYINNLRHLLLFHERPLITCYPPGMVAEDHDIWNNPIKYESSKPRNLRTGMYSMNALTVGGESDIWDGGSNIGKPQIEFEEKPDHYKFSTQGRWYESKFPFIKGFLFSANTVFTIGKWCKEVPYDEKLLFIGEEPSLALRSWTNGYDIFHMSGNPSRHYYPRDYRFCYWDSDVDSQREPEIDRETMDKQSNERQKELYTGKLKGIYGVGKVRSIEDYKDFCGIDYKNKHFEIRSYTGEGVLDQDYREKT